MLVIPRDTASRTSTEARAETAAATTARSSLPAKMARPLPTRRRGQGR